MTSLPSSEGEQTPKAKNTRLALLIATFFYSGYIRRAPGTFASLVTTLLWAPLIFLGASSLVLVAAAFFIFGIGVWASQKALASFDGNEDPGAIVIDEVAGQTLALALCPPNILTIVLAFLLFRVFDIAKPWPIGWLDRNVKGGLGIMLDDMVAGGAALLSVKILTSFWNALQ